MATPFTGAWSQIQLALVNVVVQSIPDLSKGSVNDADLTALLAEGADDRPVRARQGQVAGHDR